MIKCFSKIKELYTVEEISLMCYVNQETVRRWIRSGKLNGKHIINSGIKSHGYLITIEDLKIFMTNNPKYYLPIINRDEQIHFLILKKHILEKKFDEKTKELKEIENNIKLIDNWIEELKEESD